MEDSFRQQGLRRQMAQALRQRGITDPKVLDVMQKVPRHWFMAKCPDTLAYSDEAVPILCDQTISRPSTVAFQTQLLDIRPGMKVLEIGTGSGYQTAVLCEMGATVFTIERQKGLFDKTKRLLYDLRYHARCYLGDGYQGLTEVDYGPFDRIIITCGAPHIPPALLQQLHVGGIMVIPVGIDSQEMLRIRKTDGEPVVERFGNFKFVPMLANRQF